MNILFLTQVLPYPLDAGPKTRAYYVLRHLADSGHRISLLTFTRESDRSEYFDHLRLYCPEIHTVRMPRSRIRDGFMYLRTIATGSPFLVSRDWVSSMARIAKGLVCNHPPFDAIHADQLWMAPYAQIARGSAPSGSVPLTVLDQHNAVFNIPRRLAERATNPCLRALLNMESRRLARYERDLCRKFDRVVWVTNEDRKALFDDPADSADINGSHTVIPIALDPSSRTCLPKRDNAHRITFLGGLHWPPNIDGIRWFQREVWPLIKDRISRAVLTIIGKNPGWKPGIPPDPSIEFTGYVSDPMPYLAETAVFIVPLLAGGGMRVKILDAWSWALPVVSTRIGAEGIHARHGGNLMLADDPDSFASAVVEIMKDPELACRLSQGGRQTLELLYDWRNVYQAWDRIYPCASCTSSLMRPA
jgi:glycosyltransferase involved in cell wall biosynthesis